VREFLHRRDIVLQPVIFPTQGDFSANGHISGRVMTGTFRWNQAKGPPRN
jgi:hypothetical protein